MLERRSAFRKRSWRFAFQLALVLWVHVAGAQEHVLWIGFDEDPASETGCEIETATGLRPPPAYGPQSAPHPAST